MICTRKLTGKLPVYARIWQTGEFWYDKQKRPTDMCVFECTDIIGAISTHQRRVAKPLQRRYHKLFLLRHDPGKHFDVRQQPVDCVVLGLR